jgi:hypothetical protein
MEAIFVSLQALLLMRYGRHEAAPGSAQSSILIAFAAQVKSYSGW